MNAAGLAKFLDVVFTAVSVGLEREAIVAKVREMEAQGATPGQITEAIAKMRDEAIAAAQNAIDGA